VKRTCNVPDAVPAAGSIDAVTVYRLRSSRGASRAGTAGQGPLAGRPATVVGGLADVVVVGAAAVVVVMIGSEAGVDVDSGPAAGLEALEQAPAAIAVTTASRHHRPVAIASSCQCGGNYRAHVPLTPTCVWKATAELVIALDDHFGEPTDAYVNGSQVWLRDDGPGGITIEGRLHPVPGYRRPATTGTYEVFSTTALALATDSTPPAPLEQLWEGLEAFAAYGDELEPATLATAVTEAIGIPPDASGLVDHRAVGDEWERTGGGTSILSALLDQLRS
jgi:hypothetical protein